MSDMNGETFDAALAAERDHIKRAQADSEGLEIECVFTDEEVVAVIDQLEAAHKRDVEKLRECLKEAINGCSGCKDVGVCGSPLPFKGCRRKAEWRKVLDGKEDEE